MTMRKVKPESQEEMFGGSPKSASAKVYYPTVSFDTKTLPESKGWEVGKTYEITLEITMRGISQRKGRDGKEVGSADFDVIGIEPGEIVKGKKGKKVLRYEETGGAKDENEKPGE